MSLEELQRKLREVDLHSLALEAIRENSEVAEDLLTKDQLFDQGIGGDGRPLEPPYSPFYADFKRAIGLPSNRVTLFLEGDYHRSVFTKADRFPVTFGFHDQKAGKITQKYGTEHKELTKENKEVLADHVKPVIVDKFKRSMA